MVRLWSFLRAKGNREILTWLGGGAVTVIAGLWAAFVYFMPAEHHSSGGGAVAKCGSIAIDGSVRGSTITDNSVSTNCSQN
jgi:hypothetical protein